MPFFTLVIVTKDFIELLSDSNKSSPLWHLFDTSSTNVSTSGPETSQNVQHCSINITPVSKKMFRVSTRLKTLQSKLPDKAINEIR